jgi:hypothetical protein
MPSSILVQLPEFRAELAEQKFVVFLPRGGGLERRFRVERSRDLLSAQPAVEHRLPRAGKALVAAAACRQSGVEAGTKPP